MSTNRPEHEEDLPQRCNALGMWTDSVKRSGTGDGLCEKSLGHDGPHMTTARYTDGTSAQYVDVGAQPRCGDCGLKFGHHPACTYAIRAGSNMRLVDSRALDVRVGALASQAVCTCDGPARVPPLEPGRGYVCMKCKLPVRLRDLNDVVREGPEGEPLHLQVKRLADMIVQEIPGEPSQNEGAIDCAIRLLRAWGPLVRELREPDHHVTEAEVEAVWKELGVVRFDRTHDMTFEARLARQLVRERRQRATSTAGKLDRIESGLARLRELICARSS